jgi:hypothetical protein
MTHASSPSTGFLPMTSAENSRAILAMIRTSAWSEMDEATSRRKRIDHAGNDERELNLAGSRFQSIKIGWYQVSRIHRVCCVPGRGAMSMGFRLDQIWGVEYVPFACWISALEVGA